jgi:prephenate dehydratase
VRVAFLGPRGTHSEEALRVLAPAGAEPASYATVHDVIAAVRDRRAERAVVPIENSLEGSVAATLDTLALDAPDVRIVAERALAVRQCLVARDAVNLPEIERVLSHPQALAQCARFLRRQLPTAELAAAASTADAVSQVAGDTGRSAAIGSRLAAEVYGCRVLREGIEDHRDNVTRFVDLARAEETTRPDPNVPTKTSIVFFGFNDVSPGALVAVLGELSSREVNLTKIESRPRRVGLGHYMFFADLEGAVDEPRVAAALEGLAARVQTLHVLGSYPSDDPPGGGARIAPR